jgi:hypothetical protein
VRQVVPGRIEALGKALGGTETNCAATLAEAAWRQMMLRGRRHPCFAMPLAVGDRGGAAYCRPLLADTCGVLNPLADANRQTMEDATRSL